MRIFITLFLLVSLVSPPSYSAESTKSVWNSVQEMVRKKHYGMLELGDKVSIKNSDVKARYGAPNSIEHHAHVHPPTHSSIWRYELNGDVLEFQFFYDTSHLDQIELYKKGTSPYAS